MAQSPPQLPSQKKRNGSDFELLNYRYMHLPNYICEHRWDFFSMAKVPPLYFVFSLFFLFYILLLWELFSSVALFLKPRSTMTALRMEWLCKRKELQNNQQSHRTSVSQINRRKTYSFLNILESIYSNDFPKKAEHSTPALTFFLHIYCWSLLRSGYLLKTSLEQTTHSLTNTKTCNGLIQTFHSN